MKEVKDERDLYLSSTFLRKDPRWIFRTRTVMQMLVQSIRFISQLCRLLLVSWASPLLLVSHL